MANPKPGQHKTAGVGSKQRVIPDPVAWMQAHMGPNGAVGEAGQPVSAHGIDKPTQGDSAKNGFAGVNSHGGSSIGSNQPASANRGSGGKKAELSPNNTKKAGPMIKKGPNSHPGMPDRNALARRLHPPMGTSKAASAKEGRGRSGILAHFEGANRTNGKSGLPQSPNTAPAPKH